MSGDKKYITVRERDTGLEYIWSMSEVLEEINRDRSEDWTPYDETDWREGLSEFTEFDLIHVIGEESCKHIS